MILEGIFNIFFSFVYLLISLLPTIKIPNHDLTGFARVLSSAYSLLPAGFPMAFFANVSLITFIKITWSLIEWVYKKIPGVN